jgi:4-amino-4-deoxy-L-arabinose transferase-like glycosyltransferase
VAIGLAAVFTAALQTAQLGSSPPYLSIEEISVAREAVVLASTGRNADGQLFPLYFPDHGSHTVREPVWVYGSAALLSLLPFSETLVRAPSAIAAVIDVVLMFFVAREIFGSTALATIASAMLLLSPGHFIQGRIASMQIGMVTMTLAWVWFMARYLRMHRRRDVVLASASLAAGIYIYAAALVMTPIYFAVTVLLVMRQRDAAVRSHLLAACAIFGLLLLPIAVWFALHPHYVFGEVAYYTRGDYNKNMGWRGFLGADAVHHADMWWSSFSPDHLFFSGDADMRFSTRTAGYFLLAMAFPLAIGFVTARRSLSPGIWLLLWAGFVLAPVPAAVVSNDELKRFLTLVPFAVLIATCGVQWMVARGRVGRLCFALLIAFGLLQAGTFLNYYFGDYRAVAAKKMGGNLPGVVHEMLAQSAPTDCILLAVEPYYFQDAWNLYTRAYRRNFVTTRRFDETSSCAGVTALAEPDDPRFEGWRTIAVPEMNGEIRMAVYHR